MKNQLPPLNESKENVISIKDWMSYLLIENYYEYFLIREYLHEMNVDSVRLSELLSRISVLNKVNKRIISNKFNTWIQMTKEEKDSIKKAHLKCALNTLWEDYCDNNYFYYYQIL